MISLSKTILTKREKEVFELLIKNKTTLEIAQELNISEKTVRNHISNSMQKLDVKGTASAAPGSNTIYVAYTTDKQKGESFMPGVGEANEGTFTRAGCILCL